MDRNKESSREPEESQPNSRYRSQKLNPRVGIWQEAREAMIESLIAENMRKQNLGVDGKN